MALNKQSVPINFSMGLDTKSDPFQVPIGKFLTLQNSIFTKAGLLQKRNGFKQLTALPNTTTTNLVTFNNGLTAIGTNLYDYSAGSNSWINKGLLQPCKVSVLPAVRSAINNTQSDSVISSNGLACAVFTSVNNTTTTYDYSILDSSTGQVIIPPTPIVVSAGAISGAPKIFSLGRYFVIVLTVLITGTYHLQYITINSNNPSLVSTPVNISSQYTPSATGSFDGIVANNNLYLAWNGNDGGGAIRLTYITQSLTQSNVVAFSGHTATLMTISVDNTQNSPIIYASFYDSGSSTGYSLAVSASLGTIHAPVPIISSGTILNITSCAKNGVNTIFYEVQNYYAYDSSIQTDYIESITVAQSGTVGTPSVVARSVGLASRAFSINNSIYFLTSYSSPYQPSYFLLNSLGQVVAKLAYSNGGGYLIQGLPNVSINGTIATISYLYKDLIAAANKTQGASVAGIYSQTGINLASFDLSLNNSLSTCEIAGGLNLSGGFLWHYDGVTPVENNFFLWPDSIEATPGTGSGSMTAQQYFYVAVYQRMDGAGNIEYSAPSVPVSVTLSGAENQVVVNVPTIRLTYKLANPVQIVIYRWSAAQQIYYQVTSLTSPILNDPTVDSIAFTDKLADSAILGNSILYTTGGVVEDISPPATNNIGLYKSRVFLIDAEDQNLMWYSKQVIENTPVEMSDLFTIYVAPTIGAQGNTGPLTILSAMDDKLIMFKKNAIYYITGNGPDNTGANNDFSDPIFITATVGSANQNSVVLTPVGLMFQSDKGIWLLGRDLSTNYIGAPVEAYNNNVIVSALAIPGTNQVRFMLDSGVTLMYDYYYQQWGTFSNLPSVSSTLYQELHTFVNKYGQILQETPGVYSDISNPVLLSFTTSWINLAGLQGYQRAYYFYLLASYLSPHKLTVQIAYDYNPAPAQSTIITPDNFSGVYGSDNFYGGGSPYGGVPQYGDNPQIEQWRVFLERQKCQAFQITITESFDPSYQTVPGAGFTMSGLNLVVGTKLGYPKLRVNRSVG